MWAGVTIRIETRIKVKIDISKIELKELGQRMFNDYPNYKIERYNYNFGDSGKEYTTKHLDKNLERFGYLNYKK